MTIRLCVVSLLLYGVSLVPRTASFAQAPDAAAGLVRSALVAETEGRNDKREALLRKALATAPDYAPARWHTLHVRVDGRWLAVAEYEARARKDERLVEYALERAKAPETAIGQLELARWCRRSELDERERFHLARMLHMPGATAEQQSEAMRKLGVRLVDGRYLTKEEIAEREAGRRLFERSVHRWRAHLERIEECLTGDDDVARAEALAELRAIDTPEAIPALEFCAERHSEEFGLEVIKLLSRMERQEATDSLVRHAVLASSPEVRSAAAAALRPLPLHSYVESLVGGMGYPVESSVMAQPLNGAVQLRHVMRRKGREADDVAINDVIVHPGMVYMPYLIAPSPVGDPGPCLIDVADARRRLEGEARTAVRRFEEENEHLAERNERIQTALVAATGVELPASPDAWWRWWRDYNEFTAPDQKPVRGQYHQRHISYMTEVQQASISIASTTGGQFQSVQAVRGTTCFPAGTLVWTETGRRPIEELRGGDRVLSQDQETGELAYRTVLGTTLRQPSPNVRFWCGDDKITATLGHPVWIAGEGWRMAKFLRTGQLVHTLGGAVRIRQIEEDEEVRAYNLIVSDFHSYFVGEQGILVHDNTLREPTRAVLPGLVE